MISLLAATIIILTSVVFLTKFFVWIVRGADEGRRVANERLAEQLRTYNQTAEAIRVATNALDVSVRRLMEAGITAKLPTYDWSRFPQMNADERRAMEQMTYTGGPK